MLFCLVCIFDLACFFLPSFSHLSLKHVHTHTHTAGQQEYPDADQGGGGAPETGPSSHHQTGGGPRDTKGDYRANVVWHKKILL